MDPQYQAYFDDRLNDLRFGNSIGSPPGRLADYRLSLLTAETIERALRGQSVRSDGRLVLELLANELVVEPLAAVGRITPTEIQETIAADVTTITLRAAEERDGQEEISSHGVINAISRSWGRLRSSEWGLWG